MRFALLTLIAAAGVLGHGHVDGIVADGKYFMGYGNFQQRRRCSMLIESCSYTPNFQYMKPRPKVPAWSAGGYGQGGIAPAQFKAVSLRIMMPEEGR
jgi:cellulase